MEFAEIPFFDDDVYKMFVRFFINLTFLTIIVRFLYYQYSRRRDYLFTFYMIGIIVFFICFTLKKFELDLGMALGLFAIFGILRYRTNPIEIKEMTYLFVVIGVSVINALANKKMSYVEIVAGNSIVVIAIFILERVWLSKQEKRRKIIYENLEYTKPQNYGILKDDLEKRTGLSIQKIMVGTVDYVNGTAALIIYYYGDD
ncbi:MAG: DUF4956 domain-containing protein [Maribacter sp.]|nr:DUF4956 domain-containing protein [Maribacter sp.]